MSLVLLQTTGTKEASASYRIESPDRVSLEQRSRAESCRVTYVQHIVLQYLD